VLLLSAKHPPVIPPPLSRQFDGPLVSSGWRQHKNIDAKAVSQQIIDIEVAPNGTRLYYL
jgi:hypothetical protein